MKMIRLLSATLLISLSTIGTLIAQPAPKPDIPAPADVAAPPADAEKAASGLAWKVIEKGSGTEHPTKDDIIKVQYTGWTTDGKMFDSSINRGVPSTLPLGRLIPGWVEAIPMMVTGEKRRLWIPEELAYKGRTDRPQGMLVFDIELMDFTSLKAPADVAAPPADAQKSKSGLAWKVVRPGTGKVHPDKMSVVTVNYIGWTTDGRMFDTSFAQRKPLRIQLNQVIRGWTEGLQTMVPGERRIFWIPEKLAYEGRQEPKGMLVFDVELIAVE